MKKDNTGYLNIFKIFVVLVLVLQGGIYYYYEMFSFPLFFFTVIILFVIDCVISYNTIGVKKKKDVLFYKKTKKKISAFLVFIILMSLLSIYFLASIDEVTQLAILTKASFLLMLSNCSSIFYEYYLKNKREVFGIGVGGDNISISSEDNIQEFEISSIYSAKLKPNEVLFIKDNIFNDVNINLLDYENSDELLIHLSEKIEHIEKA